MVADKEAVQAFIGSSSAIAGFTLVFLGLVVSARSSYDADTPKAVLDRYTSPAIAAVSAFAASILSIGLGAWWLLDDGHNDLVLDILVLVFALQLVLLAGSVVLTARRVWSA